MARIPGGRKLPLTEENVDLLISLLGTGKGAATQAHVLQAILGVERERTAESTRQLVAYAIVDHHWPILSSPDGYWLAGSAEEVAEACRSLSARAAGIQARAVAIQEGWAVRNDTEAGDNP
jgi:hypothetical protein